MTPQQWDQVCELFHEALDLPADQRHDFVAARSDDPTVRAEVESLLRNASLSQSPVDRPAIEEARKAIQSAYSHDASISPYLASGSGVTRLLA